MSKTSFAQSLVTCANRTLQALAVFLPLLSVLGTLVAWLEGWSILRDGWYYGMVVAGTVGFGDLSPETILGRLISVYLILPLGLLGVGVIVGRVASTIIETRDAWKHEEQEEVKGNTRETRLDVAEMRLEMAGMRLALAEVAASTRGRPPGLTTDEPVTEEEEFRRKAARVAALLNPPAAAPISVDDNHERGPLNGNRQRGEAVLLRPLAPTPDRRRDHGEPAYGTAAYYEAAYDPEPDREPIVTFQGSAPEWSAPSAAWSAPADGGATAWSPSETSSDGGTSTPGGGAD